jgi:type I restriction enzyme R subunit
VEEVRRAAQEDAKPAFLKRVAEAVEADGTVTVLRQGVKATGCKFRLAFFKPETGLNPETEVLYQANQFTVMRPGAVQREDRAQPRPGCCS